MARQGKMHSCPFQVESEMYRYAVEHENDEYKSSPQGIKCKYLVSGKQCGLWNSGNSACRAHKCRYNGKLPQRNGMCSECAYYYGKRCAHPRADLKEKQSQHRARYCDYYLTKETNYGKYRWVADCVARLDITQEVKKIRSAMVKRDRVIRNAEKEMQKHSEGSADFLYWQQKAKEKREYSGKMEELLAKKERVLNAKGGPLLEWPKPPSRKKSAKRKAPAKKGGGGK